MFRLIILFIFLLFQFSSNSQYRVIEYSLGESYETDETYIRLKDKELDIIAELNILRDSIILSKKIEEEEKLYALQLFNNLYDDTESVYFFLKKTRSVICLV